MYIAFSEHTTKISFGEWGGIVVIWNRTSVRINQKCFILGIITLIITVNYSCIFLNEKTNYNFIYKKKKMNAYFSVFYVVLCMEQDVSYLLPAAIF